MRFSKLVPQTFQPTMLSSGEVLCRWSVLPLCLLLLVSASNVSFASEKPLPVSYDLKVTIEPKDGSIRVHGQVGVPVEIGAQTLKFGLHEAFSISKIWINAQAAPFHFQPVETGLIFPATKEVVVNMPGSAISEKVHLEIDYEGRLKDIPEFGTFPDQKLAMDDQINSRLVELANYSSWYPQFGVYGHPIESALEVSLPAGWFAACSGKKLAAEEKDGRSITRWSSPRDTDILITAAPNYKRRIIPSTQGLIEIYYTQLPEIFVDREGRDIATIVNLFHQAFGDTSIPSGTIKHVFSPKRRGQGRAGIARPGIIVTSEGRVLDELARNASFSLFQDVAHEIAHFWWNFGAGQGDWINEAFAEYSSALAVEHIASEEEFQKVLWRYRAEVRELPADSPPLANVPFDGSAFAIRYYKGSLMLDSFRQAMGSERFYSVAREFIKTYKNKSIGTEDFRTFWRKALKENGYLVDAWLESSGGLPNLNKSASF